MFCSFLVCFLFLFSRALILTVTNRGSLTVAMLFYLLCQGRLRIAYLVVTVTGHAQSRASAIL